MKCQDCKFFEAYYEGSAGGNCRRYAPAIGQPEVGVNDWCGEFCPTLRAVDPPSALVCTCAARNVLHEKSCPFAHAAGN